MARPRFCCAGEADEGNRVEAHAVDGRTRAEMEATAFVVGACRESILICGCAQLSSIESE